jgi:hypothetical protein
MKHAMKTAMRQAAVLCIFAGLYCAALAQSTPATAPAPYLLPFNNGKEDKPAYGFMDANGRVVLQPLYRWAGRFEEGRALVRYIGEDPDAADLGKDLPEDPAELDQEDYGLIDEKGRLVKLDAEYPIPFSEKRQQYYYLPYHFSEGLLRFKKGNLWGYVSRDGKVAIAPRFAYAEDFKEGLARVLVANGNLRTAGYIDKTGKLIIGAQFQQLDDEARLNGSFSEGLAVVKANGKYGYINKAGVTVIAPQYDRVGAFREGLAWVSRGGKYGYIDKTGKVAIALQFENAYDFSEGLAHVEKLNDLGFSRDGFIDKTGKLVIENKYGVAGSFSEGLAYVSEGPNDNGGFINKQGQMLLPLKRPVVNHMAATHPFYYRFKNGVVPILYAAPYANFGYAAFVNNQSMTVWGNDSLQYYCPPAK